jgi:peptidoglycan/xylan/chitin deacetylase (PgdA/CDA1 family)
MSADRRRQPTLQHALRTNLAQLGCSARRALAQVAAVLQGLTGNRCDSGFGILMYHRIADLVPGVAAPTWNVTPYKFRQQLAGLIARGFEARPLSALIESHLAGEPIPSRAFAVTFDDGHESVYKNAWPIMRELNVPATVFLATKYLDSEMPFPFDDWPAAGHPKVPTVAWRPLTTPQCREMLADGCVELGAHTHSHDHFLGRADDFRRDLQTCIDVLHERFNISRPSFAFPFGERNSATLAAVSELNLACSLSSRQHRVQPGDPLSDWGRFVVTEKDTPAIIAAELSGWYATIVRPGRTIMHSVSSWAPARRSRADRKVSDLSNDPTSNHAVTQT